MARNITLGNVRLELLEQGTEFLGIGEVRIGDAVVRSGALPMRPFTQTLDGLEYDHYEITGIERAGKRIVIRTRALATYGNVHVRLDHSLDPIWSSKRWDGAPVLADSMDWIIEAHEKQIGGLSYAGFTYQYRFRSTKNSIWYILDRASWELDGRADGITLLRQQMGTDPLVTLRRGTRYSTSGCIPFPLNPVMTYDVPRWASEQGFDYQYRDDRALIGLFASAGLIRAIVERDPAEATIRHLDKHIFDADRKAATTPKFIGLARGVGDATEQTNNWTRVFDADQDNVLGEFGMRRPVVETSFSHNFWHSFDCDTYRKEVIPGAVAIGAQKIFIDPFWENDMTRTREGKIVTPFNGNMCCPHEYEVGKVLGGVKGYKRLADDCRKLGIELQSWIGSHQSVHSPLLHGPQAPHRNDTIRVQDGRHLWMSGYESIIGMDISTGFGTMFRDAVIRAAKATGVTRFLYDSFFNFGFMPVSYYAPDPKAPQEVHKGSIRPHTQWRQLVEIMAAWQKAGLNMTIESLGPWGQGQHGVQGHYEARGSEPLAYQCSVSIGYSVIPAPGASPAVVQDSNQAYYRFVANKAPLCLGLGSAKADNAAFFRQANQDYRAVAPLLHTRTLLAKDAGVRWVDASGRKEAVFAYRKATVPVPPQARVTDVTAGRTVHVSAGKLVVEPLHTYLITSRR